MNDVYRNLLKDVSLIILTASLLVLSLPNANIYILAWVGLVPLLIAISEKQPLKAFALSQACGMMFFMGIFHWIFEISGYTYIHHSLLALYLGSYFGSFGLALSVIRRKCGPGISLVSAPFIWVSLEYLRSNMFFLALPWGLLAHSQHNNPLIIQIASITGAYGVSCLIVMVNAAIAGLVVFMSSHKKALRQGEQREGATEAGVVVLSTVALTSLLFAVGFGVFQLLLPISGERIKVSVVQGNIEQAKKWDRKYANMIMKTYTDLSFEAATDGPMLIVWPETATPKAINLDQEVFRNVNQIVQEKSIPILLGSSQQQKYGKKESFKTRYTNSAFLMIPREGRLEMQRYDKIRLLPFSEYLPMRGTVPWSVIKVPDFPGYAAGDKFAVFKVGDVEFGVTICWENIFPELVREFVRNGSQFIVNITNEARFGESAAPYQFLAMSIMRAVENRVFVVRSANTGISCFIDPCGRVLDRVKEINGPDIFVQGVLTQSIVPSSRKTPYTRYGNWLVWLSMLWSVAILIVSFCKKPQMIWIRL